MRKIIILGASGSIGQQTLDVIEHQLNDFELVGFSIGNRIEVVDDIILKHPAVKFVVCKNLKDVEKIKKNHPKIEVYHGDEGIISLIENANYEMVVNALVGFVGFVPTIRALTLNKEVALANKETLVVGGELINKLLKEGKGKLFPIDSEHVALAKCLKGQVKVKKLILTASGGSFRSYNREQLKDVKKEQALKHPSWQMGAKITIDSATMMNKGFELIEAHYLFDMPMSKIDILMHDESQIHSLVQFEDNSFLADLGPSDMRIPISYALNRGQRHEGNFKELDFTSMMTLHFHAFEPERFPCVGFAKKALKVGGTLPTVLNAANEVAVYAFLNDEISFLQIEEIIEHMMNSHRIIDNPSVEDIVYVDEATRVATKNYIKELGK